MLSLKNAYNSILPSDLRGTQCFDDEVDYRAVIHFPRFTALSIHSRSRLCSSIDLMENHQTAGKY